MATQTFYNIVGYIGMILMVIGITYLLNTLKTKPFDEKQQ